MMSANTTKERILDAAETLFAELGVDGTSLRAVTRLAAVNLAAVNYHFGSKNGLVRAAFIRRVAPINGERLRLLTACERRCDGGELPLTEVVYCFVAPVFLVQLEDAADRQLFLKLMGRLYAEPGEMIRAVFREEFTIVFQRFLTAFRRALPGRNDTDLIWGMQFTAGVLAHALLANDWLSEIIEGECDPRDHDDLIARIVTFASAGLRAAHHDGGRS